MQKNIACLLCIFIVLALSGCAPHASETSSIHTIAIQSVHANDPTIASLFGVISGPDQPENSPAPELTKQYQDIGVTSIRNNDYYDDRLDLEQIFNCGGPTYPSWEGCDASDDANYFWTESDAQFQSYLDGSFEPFLRLGGEWENADQHHDFKGPQNALQENNWIIAALKELDRYNSWGGEEHVLTYVNIWTEFPGEHFWDRSNPAFFTFWAKAYTAIKAAHPELKVGGPGFVASVTKKVHDGDGGIAEAFLAYLYENGIKPDWIGWHIFSNDPQEYLDSATAYKELLTGTGIYRDVAWAGTGYFDNVALIVDAYGNSQIENSAQGPTTLSAAEQDKIYNKKEGATLLTASWIALQYSDVDQAFFYRGNDPKSSPSSKNIEAEGLVQGLFYGDSTGTYKPKAYAFRLWSQLKKYPTLLTVDTPSSSQGTTLWALAGENSAGDIALLVANPSADSVQWDISYNEKSLSDYGSVSLYQVDDEETGETALPVESPITIPAYTVQLVLLKE